MSQIPLGTQFIGLASTVNTVERRSSLINNESAPYTMQDIVDTVSASSTKPIFMVTGAFVNMFGGDPGGTGKDVLEWNTSATSAAVHSSVFALPYDAKIIAVGWKWISSNPVPAIGAGVLWEVKAYKMSNPLTGSTTADGNFVFAGDLGIVLSQASSGTTPGAFQTGLNIPFNAGDIIRIAGVETGAIATGTDESELTVVFQLT